LYMLAALGDPICGRGGDFPPRRPSPLVSTPDSSSAGSVGPATSLTHTRLGISHLSHSTLRYRHMCILLVGGEPFGRSPPPTCASTRETGTGFNPDQHAVAKKRAPILVQSCSLLCHPLGQIDTLREPLPHGGWGTTVWAWWTLGWAWHHLGTVDWREESHGVPRLDPSFLQREFGRPPWWSGEGTTRGEGGRHERAVSWGSWRGRGRREGFRGGDVVLVHVMMMEVVHGLMTRCLLHLGLYRFWEHGGSMRLPSRRKWRHVR
jgi:hypothetical protein